MNISGITSQNYSVADAGSSAAQGIRDQLDRLDANVAAVSQADFSDLSDSSSSGYALVEQQQIVNAVRANARSLEASQQTLGTILDIKI